MHYIENFMILIFAIANRSTKSAKFCTMWKFPLYSTYMYMYMGLKMIAINWCIQKDRFQNLECLKGKCRVDVNTISVSDLMLQEQPWHGPGLRWVGEVLQPAICCCFLTWVRVIVELIESLRGRGEGGKERERERGRGSEGVSASTQCHNMNTPSTCTHHGMCVLCFE